jgi:hypothetical protein
MKNNKTVISQLQKEQKENKMMSQFLKILNVFLFVTLNLSVSTNLCASDSEEDVIIHTGKRKLTHTLSDSEGDDEESVHPNDQSLATNVYAEDSDEEFVIHTARRNSTHILSDSEEEDGEESEEENDVPNISKKTRTAIIKAVKSGL